MTKYSIIQAFFCALANDAEFLEALASNLITDTLLSACVTKAKQGAAKKMRENPVTFQKLTVLMQHHESLVPEVLCAAVNKKKQLQKKQRRQHRDHKIALVHFVDLLSSPKSYTDLGYKVIFRQKPKTSYVSYHPLCDAGNEDACAIAYSQCPRKLYIINSGDPEWYIVQPDESVVFINPDTNCVEIAVLRLPTTGRWKTILDYVNEVITEICEDRKSVRPGHRGHMAGMGYTWGQRNKQTFGLYNNWNKLKRITELSPGEKQHKDEKALGIFAFAWQLMLAKLPAETTQPVVSKLESEQLPEMDSLFSNAERGYTLHFADEVLTFPLVRRAPPEGFVTRNYEAHSHHDQQYAPYAFNWATCCDLPAAHTDGVNYGGHYVDLDYKVEVRGSGNTLMALHENHLHGTTLARDGLQRAGLAVTFSQYFYGAFKKAFGNSEDTDIVKELDDMVI